MNHRLTAVRQPAARGMIFIHSTPAALCPHIEWAVGSVLNSKTSLGWTEQQAERGKKRAELSWVGAQGTGSAIASALADFGQLRFEVVEEASPGSDGQRFCYTPALGPFTATIGVHGDVLLREDAVKRVIAEEALGERPSTRRWSGCWACPGTTSWRSSATPAKRLPCAGCTR